MKPSATITVPEVLPKFIDYFQNGNPAWGALHIVLEDGNIQDSHVKFCLDFAKQQGDTAGEELAQILLLMSKSQRKKLYKMNFENFWVKTTPR